MRRKFRVGNKVEIRRCYIHWIVKHLDAYGSGNETKLKHLREIQLFVNAYLDHKPIYGRVVKNEFADLDKEVYIKVKYGRGKHKFVAYFDDKDLFHA